MTRPFRNLHFGRPKRSAGERGDLRAFAPEPIVGVAARRDRDVGSRDIREYLQERETRYIIINLERAARRDLARELARRAFCLAYARKVLSKWRFFSVLFFFFGKCRKRLDKTITSQVFFFFFSPFFFTYASATAL